MTTKTISARAVATFTDTALAAIEAPSMKAWAASPTNLPIVRQMAKSVLEKDRKADPLRFAAYLMAIALG